MLCRVVAASIMIAVIASTATSARGGGAAETLPLNVSFRYTFDPVECPAGTAMPSQCFAYTGQAAIPGLGRVSITWLDAIDVTDPLCVRDLLDGSITAPRGVVRFAAEPARGAPCIRVAAGTIALAYTITGGTGSFEGATGGGAFTMDDNARRGRGQWDGTLTVPGYSFDTTPPVLHGAVPKSVTLPRKARVARVRFSVTATDEVDGSVGVDCSPRSGSVFRIGTTRIHCTAVDSSENRSTATFKVTVRRHRK